MSIFYQEQPSSPSRTIKFFKHVFPNCTGFTRRLQMSNPEEEREEDCPTIGSNIDEEVILSVIRSRALEKMKHTQYPTLESFSSDFFTKAGQSVIKVLPKPENTNQHDEREDFFSVGSCLSCRCSVVSREAFASAKSTLSRCSSFDQIDILDNQRRSIILDFCHCEGWPFGLCRKAILLPPLPKSPSESWSWHKDAKALKMHMVSSTTPLRLIQQ